MIKSLTPVLFIVLAIGLFYTFINPHYEKVRSLSKEAGEYREALTKADELRAVRDNLLTQYNSIPSEDVMKLKRIIPDSVNTVKLVTDLDDIAGKYGITIRNISVTQEEVDNSIGVTDANTSKPYGTTIITFKFVTTYNNLISYLQDIERSLQLVDVTSVTFSSGASTNQTYDYTVSIQTYWLKQDGN